MTTSINPTVGRKVWFYTGGGAGHHCIDPSQPYDATVVFVWGPNMVNLLVVDHAGNPHVETSVTLLDPTPEDCHGHLRNGSMRYATWMPYQMGQAVKGGATA